MPFSTDMWSFNRQMMFVLVIRLSPQFFYKYSPFKLFLVHVAWVERIRCYLLDPAVKAES